MTPNEARDALYTMFKDAWDDPVTGWQSLSALGVTTEPPVFYDNVRNDGSPGTDKVKMEVSVHHTDKPMSSFGNGRPSYDARGLVVVRIYTPKDTGLTLSDALVNIARRAFQAKRGTGTADTLVLRGTVNNEEGAQDRWFMVRAVTPFEYQDEVV